MKMLKKIKKYYKICKYKVWSYFFYKSYIYINFNIFKFYKDWWKVRKVFYKPVLKKYKMGVEENNLGSDYMYIETLCYNKWLYINSHQCDYKLKFGEIRFENVPYLCIIWRNKTKWIFGLEAPLYEELYSSDTPYISKNNLLYWEGILTYLWEYNKDIIKTYNNNIWYRSCELKDIDNTTNKNKIHKDNYTILNALKPKYADIIIDYVNNKWREKQEEKSNSENKNK